MTKRSAHRVKLEGGGGEKKKKKLSTQIVECLFLKRSVTRLLVSLGNRHSDGTKSVNGRKDHASFINNSTAFSTTNKQQTYVY